MEVSHELISEYDVILINEGQFFKDILEFCTKYCDTHKKHIVVCGLDGDYLRKPFGQINDLISMADEITKLKAFCTECNDGTSAIFTWRLSSNKEQVSIGTDYVPLCRKHYLGKYNLEKKTEEVKTMIKAEIDHVLSQKNLTLNNDINFFI